MSKSRHRKFYDYNNDDGDKVKKDWRDKRNAKRMKANLRSKSFEYTEEDDE